MRVLSYILCAVMFIQIMFANTAVKISAQEAGAVYESVAAEVVTDAKVITGFEKLSDVEQLYYFSKEDKPDLTSLLEMFPETLDVFVGDFAETTALEVTWYCVGEDYENSEAYYFQFSPEWDEAQYRVKEGIEVLKDAPYIAVFFSDDDISSISVTGRENEKIIYEFLRNEMRLNAAAACGVLANIYHESGFNPNAAGDNGTSYGICQWHNERWDAMKSWCEKNGYDWTTLTGQLYYLRFELSQNNYNYLWNGRTIYNYISNVPDTAEGAYDAGYYWCFYYEVPANREIVSVTRGNLAKNTYWAEYGDAAIAPAVNIMGVTVTDVSKEGYTVSCIIEDIDKIEQVQFPTWTVENGQDDLDVFWETSELSRGTVNGKQVVYRVDASDHNGETGLYYTEIHAYDTDGNVTCIPVAANIGNNVLTPRKTLYFEGNLYEVYVVENTIAARTAWTWAKTYAESIGGHLVTIGSQAEQEAVNSLVTDDVNGYWIGGTDEVEEGIWNWVTAETFAYQNWASEEPVDLSGRQDYAVLWADTLTWGAVENDSAQAKYGFICEIEDYVYDYEETATIPMYRLYNPNSGEHFYTGSVEERDILDEAGWTYEGIAWNAPVYIGAPVHRMFNPNSGDHHYTMSQEEVDMLVGAGWKYEGVAWNSASADNLPLYRLYNPNADCGSHHYTGSEEERDNLVSVGWQYEGVGWFGLLK